MTEKIISTISKIYAKSLIDVAMESNSLDKFHQQLGEVLSVLKSSCDLQKVIGNPTIKNEDKVSVLDEIFSSRVDSKILNLLKLLIEKNRFDELESISKAENNIKRMLSENPDLHRQFIQESLDELDKVKL